MLVIRFVKQFPKLFSGNVINLATYFIFSYMKILYVYYSDKNYSTLIR